MKNRSTYIVFLACCLLGLAAIAAWGNSTASARSVYPWLLGAIVLIGAIGTFAFRTARERATLAAEAESVESHTALRVRAAAFVDALVLAVLLGTLTFTVGSDWPPGFVMLGYVVALVIDVCVRSAVSTTRYGSQDAEQDS